jgi:hypothetical protein
LKLKGNRNLIKISDAEKINLMNRMGDSKGSKFLGVDLEGQIVSKLSGFTNWLGKQLIGIPTVGLLNSVTSAIFGAGFTQALNWGMGVADLLRGDPTGLIVQGVMAITSEMNFQHERDINNDHPTAWKYSHFGYVKDTNDGKWYPGYVESRSMSHGGLGGRDGSMNMIYGENPIMFKDGVYFEDPHTKTLFIDDQEFDGEKYGTTDTIYDFYGLNYTEDQIDKRADSYFMDSYDFVKHADVTRDWFFVPSNDVNTWLQGDLEGFPLSRLKTGEMTA